GSVVRRLHPQPHLPGSILRAFEQREAIQPYMLERGAPRQRADLMPSGGKPRGEKAAHGAEADDADAHEPMPPKKNGPTATKAARRKSRPGRQRTNRAILSVARRAAVRRAVRRIRRSGHAVAPARPGQGRRMRTWPPSWR